MVKAGIKALEVTFGTVNFALGVIALLFSVLCLGVCQFCLLVSQRGSIGGKSTFLGRQPCGCIGPVGGCLAKACLGDSICGGSTRILCNLLGLVSSGGGTLTLLRGIARGLVCLTCFSLGIIRSTFSPRRTIVSHTGGSLHISNTLVGLRQHTVVLVDKFGVGTQASLLEVHRDFVNVVEPRIQALKVSFSVVDLVFSIVALLFSVLRFFISQRGGIISPSRILRSQLGGIAR